MKVRYSADSPGVRRRYEHTLDFLKASLPPPARILDLDPPNPLSEFMESAGYEVMNTGPGVDLDLDRTSVENVDVHAVTGFEILEHLVAPFDLLRQIRAPRLYATVPLRLWFASAYRHPTDPWDRHFHEFEDWQFDWLLEKAGWEIVRREKWTSPVKAIGFRPLLRRTVPRYYAVECRRHAENDA